MVKFGLLVTVFWLSGISVLLGFKWEEATNMPLSSWGSLLSGISAPITFL